MKKEKSGISVIVPCYNEATEIINTIDALVAVLEPHFENFEIVVVDDGGQPEIDINYQGSLNIQFFRIEHGGAPKARNFGFAKSQGELVLFCDADMELKQDCLEKMYKKL